MRCSSSSYGQSGFHLVTTKLFVCNELAMLACEMLNGSMFNIRPLLV